MFDLENVHPGEVFEVEFDKPRKIKWTLQAMADFERKAREYLIKEKLAVEPVDAKGNKLPVKLEMADILGGYIDNLTILEMALESVIRTMDDKADAKKAVNMSSLTQLDLQRVVFGAWLAASNPLQLETWKMRQIQNIEMMPEIIEAYRKKMDEEKEITGKEPSTED